MRLVAGPGLIGAQGILKGIFYDKCPYMLVLRQPHHLAVLLGQFSWISPLETVLLGLLSGLLGLPLRAYSRFAMLFLG